MKKIIVLIAVLALFVASAHAQNQFGIAFGLRGLNYVATLGTVENNKSSSIGVDYRRSNIWSVSKWKIGVGGMLGLGIGKNTSNWSNVDNIIYLESSDQLRCGFNGFREEQSIRVWELTAMVHAIMPNEKISFGIGPSLGFASGEWSSAGQVTTSLYDDASGVWLGDDIVGHGLESSSFNWSDKLNLRTQISLALEVGWYPYDNMYLGVYGTIPITSLISGSERPLVERTGNVQNQELLYRGLFNSDCLNGSVKMWSLGLKLGLCIDKKQEKPHHIVSGSENESIRENNTKLIKQINQLQDSLSKLNDRMNKVLSNEAVDPTKYEFVLFRYGQMCIMLPYDKALCVSYENYYNQYKNNFINDGFRDGCAYNYEIIHHYEQIQQDFINKVNSFSARYKKADRTGRDQILTIFLKELNDYKSNLTRKYNIDEDDDITLSFIFRKINQLRTKFNYYVTKNKYPNGDSFSIEMNDILENSEIYNTLK